MLVHLSRAKTAYKTRLLNVEQMGPKPIKRKKYADKPKEPLVVVLNPWGFPNNGRGQRDVDAFATWLRCMLSGLGQPDCIVEAVYVMNTVSDVPRPSPLRSDEGNFSRTANGGYCQTKLDS